MRRPSPFFPVQPSPCFLPPSLAHLRSCGMRTGREGGGHRARRRRTPFPATPAAAVGMSARSRPTPLGLAPCRRLAVRRQPNASGFVVCGRMLLRPSRARLRFHRFFGLSLRRAAAPLPRKPKVNNSGDPRLRRHGCRSARPSSSAAVKSKFTASIATAPEAGSGVLPGSSRRHPADRKIRPRRRTIRATPSASTRDSDKQTLRIASTMLPAAYPPERFKHSSPSFDASPPGNGPVINAEERRVFQGRQTGRSFLLRLRLRALLVAPTVRCVPHLLFPEADAASPCPWSVAVETAWSRVSFPRTPRLCLARLSCCPGLWSRGWVNEPDSGSRS